MTAGPRPGDDRTAGRAARDLRPHRPTTVALHTGRRPHTFDALLIDANMRQALVATRALARSGVRVALAESPDECDPKFRVPTFASRGASWHTTLPGLREDPRGYVEALVALLAERPARVLIPSTDGSIAAIQPWRHLLERQGVALALAADSALDVANDKEKTRLAAARLGILSPRTVPIDDPSDAREALAEVGYPAVVKPTRSWIRSGDTARQVRAREVRNEDEALAFIDDLHRMGSAAVVQQWVGGSREAVSLVYARDRVWAQFAQVAHRMTPVLGGVSVVRESIPMPGDIGTAAANLVRHLDLEGYSEVEFRRDASGRPYLMEINARLSGSLEVAVRSGVDFPTLLWRWAAREPLSPITGYRPGVRMRYLNGDVQWLVENLRHGGRSDSVPPWRAVMMFAAEFFRAQAYDYFDWRDVRPAAVALMRDIAGARRRVARLLRQSPTTPSTIPPIDLEATAA